MNTIDALLTRNSVPRLTTPIPTKDQLEIAYRCALRAPDHAWMRPWKFIQISGKGLDKLSNAFVNTAKKLNENIDPEILKKYKDAPYRAPLIIVLVADTKEHPKVPIIEQQLSTAAAGQNMLEISMELDLKENEIVIGYLYIGTIEGKTKKIPELNSKDFVITWE